MKNCILFLIFCATTYADAGAGNLTCDFGSTCFTKTLCGFSWPTTALDWDCSTARTTSLIETGPDKDHTGRGGAYLYANSRKPKQPSAKYQLWSTTLNKPIDTKVGCVSMYYHMSGADVATLSVYAVYPNRMQQREHIWTASGAQGKEWIRMERNIVFPVDAGGEFQVFIEATMPDRIGTGVAGDIAVDDLFVMPTYKCSSPTGDVTTITQRATSSAAPLTPTPKPLVTSTSVATSSKFGAGNLTCDFGSTCFTKTLCGFSWPTATLDWDCSTARISMLIASGPDKDHTGRGGAYVYANSRKPKQPNEKYQLWSPTFSKPTDAKVGCVSLYYYMSGADVATLSVYAVYPNQKQQRELIWAASGTQGKKWLRMERDVVFPVDARGEFQVLIEATMPDRIGTRVAGDIAIDDLFIAPAYKCASPTADVTTATERTTSAAKQLASTVKPLVSSTSATTLSKFTVLTNAPAEQTRQKAFCENHDSYYATNPGSGCKQFVQWTKENEVVKTIQDCGLGTIFDVDACICNWEKLTKCHQP